MSQDTDMSAGNRRRLAAPIPIRALEFKSFAYPVQRPGAAALFPPAGGVYFDAHGTPMRMHFAPGRLLVPEPDSETERQLAGLEAAGLGILFDVQSKWCAMSLGGASVPQWLSADVDIAFLLADRTCAALHLFDCPLVIAHRANDFHLWVEASYAGSLVPAMRRADPSLHFKLVT